MNLLVIVTLLISIIGLYVQVLGLQAARLYSHQTGVAQAMATWHAGAVSMAASIVRTGVAYPAAGCSLTYTVIPGAPGGFAVCPAPTGLTQGTVTNDSATVGIPNLVLNKSTSNKECVHVPATCTASTPPNCTTCSAIFDTTNHQFYSLLYKSNNQDYVITVVPAASVSATNPNGYISMARGNQIALTTSDLLQQLKHSTIPNSSFGTVSSTYVLTTPLITITLPSFTNANGAVAMISSADGF
ncbi:MAG TPA: hypothetical protein VFR09_00640 [Alphaproteobacteria bacterium]|nr:hypothetical protein [Alphaproteobacteria bacterium]